MTGVVLTNRACHLTPQDALFQLHQHEVHGSEMLESNRLLAMSLQGAEDRVRQSEVATTTHSRTHACTHTHTHMHTHTCIHMYICTYTHILMHTHAHTHTLVPADVVLDDAGAHRVGKVPGTLRPRGNESVGIHAAFFPSVLY